MKKVHRSKAGFKGGGDGRMVRTIGAAPAGAKMVLGGRGFISITRPPYQTERGGGWGESHLVPKICPEQSDSQAVRQADRKTGRQISRQQGGVPLSQPVCLKLPLVLYLFEPCDHFSVSPSSTRRGPASPPPQADMNLPVIPPPMV